MTNENQSNGKSLLERLNDVKLNMKGIGELLEPYKFGYFDTTVKGTPEDVRYLETDKYQMVAAKWEEHAWSCGVEWREWISLYYRKIRTKKISKIDTEKITTRDGIFPEKDKPYLWEYDYVSLEMTGEDSVEVAWTNKEGKKGPKYGIILK